MQTNDASELTRLEKLDMKVSRDVRNRVAEIAKMKNISEAKVILQAIKLYSVAVRAEENGDKIGILKNHGFGGLSVKQVISGI